MTQIGMLKKSKMNESKQRAFLLHYQRKREKNIEYDDTDDKSHCNKDFLIKYRKKLFDSQ